MRRKTSCNLSTSGALVGKLIGSPDVSSVSSFSSDDEEATPLSKQKSILKQPSVPNSGEEAQAELIRSRATSECNLSGLRLSRVPVKLNAANLVVLSLADNQIESLPAWLFEGAKSNLRELDLNSNKLTLLPENLFSLPHLEVLLFNHNNIETLPLTSLSLPSLRKFGAEFNQLRAFPIELIEQCPKLEELFLSQNELILNKEIPKRRLTACTRATKNNLVLRVDNRPRFAEQMAREKWAATLPWLTVELHKIYPDKVLDYLFLGSVRTAQTVTIYHDLDIAYVLTVGRDLVVNVDPDMHHLVLSVNDFPEEDMMPLFEEAFCFIDKARAAKKGILIHCFAGLSRSVTIAAAYIMKIEHKTRDEALALIRAARPAARPNDGFMNTLLEYEKKLKGAS